MKPPVSGGGPAGVPTSASRVVGWLEGISSSALIIMMLITVVDVFMRNAYNQPIVGAIELVKIVMAYLVSLAIPQTFFHRRHVQVDVIDHLVGERPLLWMEMLGEVCGLGLLAVMLWVMWGEAWDAHELGDVTSDLMIPLAVLWIPLLVGTVCSLMAVTTLIWSDARKLLQSREMS